VLELCGSVWLGTQCDRFIVHAHLELDPGQLAKLPTPPWDLPNLLHLRLRADYLDISELPLNFLSWASLPSLRSSSIDPRRRPQFAPSALYLGNILRCAPQLVALQLTEVDTLEAIEYFHAHRGDELGGGIRRKPLQPTSRCKANGAT
jgi:hypothetical protein